MASNKKVEKSHYLLVIIQMRRLCRKGEQIATNSRSEKSKETSFAYVDSIDVFIQCSIGCFS